ncbi:NADP-dependent oxidoreductase, partial [Sphingobium sp. AN641]|uniref:NADP-dependent oxidoreductase n=1 Tax=Sphingobium sp. AN641 TaxID=3133443 RepID=UPI0030BBA6D9
MAEAEQAQRIVLASRPKGEATTDNFRLEQMPIPVPGKGEILVRGDYLSLDPYMRGRMNDQKSYAAAVEIGEVMTGEAVGTVIRSNAPGFAEGDIVAAHTGWATHAAVAGAQARKIDTQVAPASAYLGVLGMPGFTAYSGLKEIGKPGAGETLVVAAASGPVGSMVGQLAKAAGARTVGIAGGAVKCQALVDEFGFDIALDHHAEDFESQLSAACPDGIDVYFENVGGRVLAAVMPLLNPFARVPVCGLVAHYSGQSAGAPDQFLVLMRDILVKSLTVRGFINYDLMEYYPAFLEEVGAGISNGAIRYREDTVRRLDQAPDAFIGMLKGKNFGKLLIQL